METSIVHSFFFLIFTSKICSPQSHVHLTSGKVWSKKDLPCLEEDSIREHLRIQDIHNSIGPNEIFTQVPKGHGCYYCRIIFNHLLNIFCINIRFMEEQTSETGSHWQDQNEKTEEWHIQLKLKEILFYCEDG